MALKCVFNKWAGDFAPLHDVAVDGAFLCYGVTGSGFPLGDNSKTLKLAANSSGQKPAGVLTQNFVYLDETLYKKNFWHNDQVTGYPAEVIRRGEVFTDMCVDTATTVGAPAYLTSSGYVTKTMHATGGLVATPLVGQFMGTPDEKGFVKLLVNLP